MPVVLIERCFWAAVRPVTGSPSETDSYVPLPSRSHSIICVAPPSPESAPSAAVAVAVIVWPIVGRGTFTDSVGLAVAGEFTSTEPTQCHLPEFTLLPQPPPSSSSASTTQRPRSGKLVARDLVALSPFSGQE